MMAAEDRDELAARWDRAAAGWAKRADRVQGEGMPVSSWMLDHAALHPGYRVLELAAGPGDTGFLAAELVAPGGGVVVCSDASEAMLEVARQRAQAAGVQNVEFRRLELEWIDLETASVDAVLCRWGVMLCLDPEAALKEIRRVLRPGGRTAIAVWDEASLNPWATVPSRALVELGYSAPPDPNAPGMFALAAPGRLQGLLQSAGFTEVLVDGVDLERVYASVDAFIEETVDLSRQFADVYQGLDEDQRAELAQTIASLAEPYIAGDGSLRLPGRSLVAAASG